MLSLFWVPYISIRYIQETSPWALLRGSHSLPWWFPSPLVYQHDICKILRLFLTIKLAYNPTEKLQIRSSAWDRQVSTIWVWGLLLELIQLSPPYEFRDHSCWEFFEESLDCLWYPVNSPHLPISHTNSGSFHQLPSSKSKFPLQRSSLSTGIAPHSCSSFWKL